MSPIPLSCNDKFEEINECSELQRAAINEIGKEFELNTEKLSEIINHFCNELNKGLEQHGQTMIPTYVTGVPTGKEVGTFLSLDLGGTNLRVCQINFEGKGKVSSKQQKYKMPESQKTGEARQLFEFIAECVDKFLTEFNIDCVEEKLHMGFTFSFPVEQTAINKGKLIKWTKGFAASGAVDKDVVFMLQESLNRKGVPVKVSALVNDTVGTLLSHAYKYPNTLLGVILGTGTNCAYFEKISNIKKLKNVTSNAEKMIVNIEWGGIFDNERKVLPLTMFDNKVDRESINPRAYIFEKLISGMYLGEITRNVLLNLIDRVLLFNGCSSKELNGHYSFETAYMSTIEEDDTDALEDTRRILEESLNITSTTLTDRQIVKRICQLVGLRAARLSSIGLSAVLSHCNVLESGCNIGIDGSLFQFYPGFKARLKTALKELFGSNADKIDLDLAQDGSGVGAAMAAMLASCKL